jgi:hypothetical protein
MERSERFLNVEDEDSAQESAPHVCKCGRAPWRPGQRNCVFCNREANRKYRESLKKQAARLAQLGDGAPAPRPKSAA